MLLPSPMRLLTVGECEISTKPLMGWRYYSTYSNGTSLKRHANEIRKWQFVPILRSFQFNQKIQFVNNKNKPSMHIAHSHDKMLYSIWTHSSSFYIKFWTIFVKKSNIVSFVGSRMHGFNGTPSHWEIKL